jgi:hypothetical protein
MSWATCYSGSNNIHFDFPPIMSDGRNFASWQPEAVVNQRIQQQENINSSWAYRQYLTHNGIQIMNFNTTEACYDMGLDQHTQTSKTPSANVPLLYKSTFDSSMPGYGYCNSDLKNPYLSREQLQSKMISPSIAYSTDANPVNSVKNT